MTCVIRALIFKMVIYCCGSSKGNSVEDHCWDVKLFPFLGGRHYFINHFISFLKCPLCLGLTGGLKKILLHKSLFSESLQISCKIACIVGSSFFLCNTIFKAWMISQKKLGFPLIRFFCNIINLFRSWSTNPKVTVQSFFAYWPCLLLGFISL